MERANWVMDYETLINCTALVVVHCKTDEKKEFVVHELRNDLEDLIKFLEGNKKKHEWHISFNGLGFDSQITQYLLMEKQELLALKPEEVAYKIYGKAKEIISRQEEMRFMEFSEKHLAIRQMDVFKMNHWDNPAKMSSLKWIQYTMDYPNIQEMPIHHSTFIKTMDEIKMILQYCTNDVLSTKEIMIRSKEQINLRNELSAEFKLQLHNASEPKIAKELFLHFLSDKMEMNKWDLKKLKTFRKEIRVKDLILPYVKFDQPEFNAVLEEFKAKTIDPQNIKGSFNTLMYHKGVKSKFGLGGIHGAKDSGVYESREGMIIMSSDVVSFYPRLAIVNKWSPAHIPKGIFTEQYQWFFDERMKLPKKDPKNYVYKIVLNSTFGLSIDKFSFLYDPQLGMQITINGQLSLLMLYEMLSTRIDKSIPLLQNTDGLETMIPEGSRQQYMDICAEWEEITGLKLEHDEYSKLFLGDVNNYIAVYKNGETKCKGRFEFKNLMLHKNKSFQVIPKAIYDFFINNITPEDSLMANKNIFDYCGGAKAKGNWKFVETCVQKGAIVKRDLQKVTRYYVSKHGCKMIKTNKNDGREIQVEAGKWLQTEYNTHDPNKPFESFDINKEFYLSKIYKEIANINSIGAVKQLTMF